MMAAGGDDDGRHRSRRRRRRRHHPLLLLPKIDPRVKRYDVKLSPTSKEYDRGKRV